MNKDKITIPVILAADNNYAPYMSVTAASILKNADENTNIEFFILIPDDFSDENKQKISSLEKLGNCKFNFMNMRDDFSTTTKEIAHITHHAYYRLKAAEILPDDIDKCFYFDCDVIVNTDLTDLFNIDLNGYYFAGVKAPGYHLGVSWNEKYCQKIGIKNIHQYINSGVLIMNLKKIRQDNLTPVLCREALNNYPTIDQDVINKVAFNYIKHLPFQNNVMTPDLKYTNKDLKSIFDLEDLQEARKNPKIIHYADKRKPWNKPFIPLSAYFWKYALNSCYMPKLLKDLIFNIRIRDDRTIINICGITVKFKIKDNGKGKSHEI